ncbi:MAG TPA: acyl carrier protein [Puia sp.]|nr:acyl carrier protein [Puia sp.]
MSRGETFRGSNSTDRVTRVIGIMIDKFAIDERSLSFQASFHDDLDIDSLDFCEFISELEKEFKISIPDDDAERMKTVGSVLDYIDKHLPCEKLTEAVNTEFETSTAG